MLIPGKTYFFFSHTKKFSRIINIFYKNIISKKITLIDYECLEHDDGTRLIGFGFFAGVVGAHNGMMAYGNRTGDFKLEEFIRKKFSAIDPYLFWFKTTFVKNRGYGEWESCSWHSRNHEPYGNPRGRT